VAKSLKQGQRDLEQLQDELEDTDAIARAYAEGVLAEAVRRAQGRPTPQAPMAADAMGIQGNTITVLTGGAPEAVSAGSEWGSTLYPQFGPRNDGGYWLMPATESAEAVAAGDRYLEQITERAVR
jgi:hypothetical protein